MASVTVADSGCRSRRHVRSHSRAPPPSSTQSGGVTDPAAAPSPPPEIEIEADKPWWRRIFG
jgi:hypothetical protein